MTTVLDDVRALEPDLVTFRRDIHRHPELAYAETRTAGRIADALEAEGIAVRRGVGGTGVVATVGASSGPTVMLRVDMDALPIHEANDVPYKSAHEGRMHACGHDGHVAMGVMATRVLARRTLPGRVRILFQPAEEGEGGAQAVIRDGGLEGVQRMLGVHLWNELPVGVLGVKDGPLMAAVDRLKIVVHGRGGHGGKPHRAADPVLAAAHVVTALQSIVSREVSPVESAVVTIGSVHGGEAFNVIPDDVTLTGTIRTFDPALRLGMPERIRRVAEGVASALQCRAEVEVRTGNPPVLNDPGMADLARRAALRVVGEEKVVRPEPTMGGEDMAVYFEQVPGCFVFVGSANRERRLDHPHHSPHFDFDESALAIGCAFLVEGAEEALRAGG
jgi:amidohydrolase